MSRSRDLLEQAHHLLYREPRRPRQASLRRSVSAAYYALFHLLVHDSAASIAGVRTRALHALVARAHQHGELREVCGDLARGQWPRSLRVLAAAPPEPRLCDVALVFGELQDARHQADYSLAYAFRRTEADRLIRRVDQVFSDWQDIRRSAEARLFLLALLFNKRWNR